MRLSVVFLAIVAFFVCVVDAIPTTDVAVESSRRLRLGDNGRYLKEKKTNVKTKPSRADLAYVKAKLSAADLTNEERTPGLVAWYFLLGPLSRSKSLDSVEETVRYGRNRVRTPLRFENTPSGKHMYIVPEKEYQAKLALAVAKDKKLAENLKGVMKKLQKAAKRPAEAP
ncbi:hypothetical protein P3T76_006123 [Phytophthora citrophthora]|uniref:RxLR effector protein n=1 Tax=Phytophthora citrophthora TaxID=4793 RepID=A0AAD9LQ19_9STRA|nr:hypothetical protein P3T76_006123 [Phytophthora citrophthora]